MMADNQEMKQQADSFMQIQAESLKKSLLEGAVLLPNGIRLLEWKSDQATPELVKNIAFMLRAEKGKLAFVAGRVFNGKPELAVMLSDALVAEGKSASQIIREAAKIMNGGGGGQPFFATAGGKVTEGLMPAIENVKNQLQ